MTTSRMEFPLVDASVGKWKISYIQDDMWIGPWIARGVEWENWMRHDVAFGYRSGTDILDIGGNIGCNALMFSDYGKVHTFEPLFHDVLQKNVSQNTLRHAITVHPYGLSDETCQKNIYFPVNENGRKNYGCCSIKPEPGVHASDSTVIDVRRLDDVYSGTPSVMKIDVEGNELEMIKGAEQTIRKHMPFLIVEIHDPEKSPVPPYLYSLGYGPMIERPHANYAFIKKVE